MQAQERTDPLAEALATVDSDQMVALLASDDMQAQGFQSLDDLWLDHNAAMINETPSATVQAPPSDEGLRLKMQEWQLEAARLWTTKVQSASDKQQSKVKTSSWYRRKVELQRLRDEVVHLEAKRQQLEVSASQVTEEEREHELQLQRHRAKVWQLELTLEQQLLRDDQKENDRLRCAVSQHAELCRVLQIALSQCRSTDVARQARLTAQGERASLLGALERKLSVVLPQVRKFLRSPGSTTCGPLHHERIDNRDDLHPVASVRRARTLPFGSASIRDDFWRRAKQDFQDRALSSGSVEFVSADAVGVKVEVQVDELTPSPETSVIVRFFSVLKRLEIEESVEVLQFAFVTDWLSPGAPPHSMTESTAWVVCRFLDSESSSSSCRMSSSTETRLVSSHWSSPGYCRTRNVRHALMKSIVLPTTSARIKYIEQVVENVLFDCSLRN